MNQFEKYLEQYNYKLPENLIAQEPIKPRDAARLMVYSRVTKKVSLDTFTNLAKYLPHNSVLVFNQTRVIPARLWLKKPTGGKIQIFYIGFKKGFIKVLADRKISIGMKLSLNDNIFFTVCNQENNIYLLKANLSINKIKDALYKYGVTPLPPYIKHSLLTEKQKRREYQTIYAKKGLSVAAPTAGLHFSKQLINRLKALGITVLFVNLNVGLGTFATLKEDNLITKKLHSEEFDIDIKTANALNKAKNKGCPIIAVGTTALRALESACVGNSIRKYIGQTELFITPGYKFKFVDGLITNFHVPKSSLLMLTAALIGRKNILSLYKLAIKNKFRFFSFGDGMLLY